MGLMLALTYSVYLTNASFLLSDEDGDGSTAIIILSILTVILFAVVMFLLLRKQIKPYLWSSNLVVITMVLSGMLNHNKLLVLFMAKKKELMHIVLIFKWNNYLLAMLLFQTQLSFPLKHKIHFYRTVNVSCV